MLDLKSFFLHASYSQEEDRDLIKMLWESCVPKSLYEFIKMPDNFEYLLSQNVSFKGAKVILQQYASQPNNWLGLKNCFVVYCTTYQYAYSMLFPKYYSQNNKFWMKSRIKFALCSQRWRAKQQLAKNPFNFDVGNRPDPLQVVERHEYEQKPIIIDDDIKFKADAPDTKKKQQVDAMDGGNRESIPLPPPPPSTYAYASTMCSIPEFDQKYSLPKVDKKPKTNDKILTVREQKKKLLTEQLNKNSDK